MKVEDKLRVQEFRGEVPQGLNRAFTRAKTGARAKDINFYLDAHDLRRMWARSKGFCEISGIRFDESAESDGRCNPYAISIDRIESTGPYSLLNTRLVCWWVNRALSDDGDEVFAEFVSAIAARYIQRAVENNPRLKSQERGPEKEDSNLKALNTTTERPDKMNDGLVDAETAARLMGVAPKTIRKWADRGAIDQVKFSKRCVRFPLESLRGFQESMTIHSAEKYR